MLTACSRFLVLSLALFGLSACLRHSQPNTAPTSSATLMPLSQAKGEWSLASLASQHDFDLSPLRYRISLRITRQEFSLAAPCARLLGHYHSNATVLRFQNIEQRDIVCAATQERHILQQMLQHTHTYHIQDDTMSWQDASGQTLAVWQRIYL